MALTDNLLDYRTAQPKLAYLISDWAKHSQQVETQRNLRDFKATSAEQMRADGKVKPDETYTPVRLIDGNIRKEQPRFLAYLVQSRRDMVFKRMGVTTSDPGVDMLEQVFTDHCRYPGWEVPFIRLIDGAQTHGWDFVEVLLDITKPGQFTVEHVGQDNLLFERNCEDIQEQTFVLRKQQMTKLELVRAIKEQEFVPDVVDEIVTVQSSDSAQGNKDIPFEVYKVYMKCPYLQEGSGELVDDVVHVGWYSDKAKNGWLRDPRPFYNGRDQKVISTVASPLGLPMQSEKLVRMIERQYPFFLLQYTIGEEHRITCTLGQTRLHEADQDAASAMLTCYVNTAIRASNVYVSVNDTDGGPPKQLDVLLEQNRIYNRAMSFFSTPPPQESLLRGVETIRTKNAEETVNVDYAVRNRRDSEKTATEIRSAEQAKADMGAVQVTLLSIAYQRIRAYCWNIFQNRVIQGKIQIAQELVQRYFVDANGDAIVYHLMPAGDTDVVKRQERLNMMLQLWPILSATPLAMPLADDIVKNALPDVHARYKGILAQAQQGKQLVQTLGQLVQQLAVGADGAMRPELAGQEGQLQQLAQQAQQYLASPAAL